MFVGHYSVAFIAKTVEPRVPLWVLFLAVQLVDVFWVLFILTGVEKVRLDPTLASNPFDLMFMPYTHSLLGAVAWAAAAGIIVARAPRLGGTAYAGLMVAICVVSHWALDLLVHRPDLTLWGAGPRHGLAVWDSPIIAYVLELLLLAGSAIFYMARRNPPAMIGRRILLLVGILFLIQSGTMFGPLPQSIPVLVLSLLGVFLGIAYAGFRIERSTAVNLTATAD